jgi:hypothetical protein
MQGRVMRLVAVGNAKVCKSVMLDVSAATDEVFIALSFNPLCLAAQDTVYTQE